MQDTETFRVIQFNINIEIEEWLDVEYVGWL